METLKGIIGAVGFGLLLTLLMGAAIYALIFFMAFFRGGM